MLMHIGFQCFGGLLDEPQVGSYKLLQETAAVQTPGRLGGRLHSRADPCYYFRQYPPFSLSI